MQFWLRKRMVIKVTRREVEIYFSAQAELFLKDMPGIKREDVFAWFSNIRKISIGGGDLADYLKWKNKEGGK